MIHGLISPTIRSLCSRVSMSIGKGNGKRKFRVEGKGILISSRESVFATEAFGWRRKFAPHLAGLPGPAYRPLLPYFTVKVHQGEVEPS